MRSGNGNPFRGATSNGLHKPLQHFSTRSRPMNHSRFAAIPVALFMTWSMAAAQDAKPTDPQIAHIAYTAGQIDIEAARLALKKSKNKNVRSFAEDMVRDHIAVNDKATTL